MKTYSISEYTQKYGMDSYLNLLRMSPQVQAKGPNIFQQVGEAFKGGINQVGEGINQSGNAQNPLQLFEGSLKMGAGAVNAAFSPLAPVFKPVGQAVNKIGDKISDIPAVQKFATSKAGEVTSRVAEDVANLDTIAAAVAGSKTAMKAGQAVPGAVRAGVSQTGELASKVTKPLKGALETTKKLTGGMIEEAKMIPERIATNASEKQATQAKINALPTKAARAGAQNGLDIGDVNYIYKIAQDQKPALKQLAQITKDFAEGKSKTNPIEAVGRPIVARINELETQRTVVGQKLGKVADKLGKVTTKELTPAVFDSLKKVNGLSGLKLDAKGKLNFKDTVLASDLSRSDQGAIQTIFDEAIKAGTGKQKHLLRQELFEILGGKKKSLSNLTDTQERAYQAVRKALSDVLESKNDTYKDLSNQYRKIAQPLQDMRGYMKKVVGAEEDILDMSAGLLARRLTSAAKSNPEIRAVLNAMDSATKVPGKTRLSVETLQDFYNILEKYYNVAPKTGFQAQITQGIEKAAGGPLNYIADQIKGFAGETPAVRQRALENILNEVLK